ncbi:MAG: hypothetical protein KBS72_04410 [Bacteroidales bacterium]|nr:hypothetical protein [Candidatus Cacconaster scatequi]
MTPDKDIHTLFDSAKSEFEDNEVFLQTLIRSLDKVEYIKQMQDRQIRRYRHTVIYALVAGVCAGTFAMVTIGNIPSDFLQSLSENANLLQVPFLEPRTVLNMAVSLFIGASVFWIARNVQEIRQTLGR